jgi:hypothetical protein
VRGATPATALALDVILKVPISTERVQRYMRS